MTPPINAEVVSEPWHWFTSTSDCGLTRCHDAHMWGEERNWCKGRTR